MDIPTPKNAPIKRQLSQEETDRINAAVLDGDSTKPTMDVDDLRQVGRGATKKPFTPRPHLMQRPFAKDPAFAELARRRDASRKKS
jgi:hypothetical protein